MSLRQACEKQKRFLRWCKLRGKLSKSEEALIKDILANPYYEVGGILSITLNKFRDAYHFEYCRERSKLRARNNNDSNLVQYM